MLRLGNTNGLGPSPPPMMINQENINGNILGQYQDQRGSFQQSLQSVKQNYVNGQLKTQRNKMPKFRRRPYPYHIQQNSKNGPKSSQKTMTNTQMDQVICILLEIFSTSSFMMTLWLTGL